MNMILKKVSQRSKFWDEVIINAKEKEQLDLMLDIRVSNKSRNENYRFADVCYKGCKGVLAEQGVSIILSVACEPGEQRAIPRLELMFHDGTDVTRRDISYRKIRENLPQYSYCRHHTNDDGMSKITVRRKKDPTQCFDYKKEAKVLVDIIEAIVNVLD